MSSVAHDETHVAPPAEVGEQELYHATTFIGRYIWSQDAKVIAVQYAVTAMGVGLLALVLSGIMRLQLAYPNTFEFITPAAYLQFVTMHGMIMVVYLLTALFLGGFGNYLIPLMVGARDMVFPYVNMLSYWIYLLSVVLLVASLFVPGGPTGAGWTLYPPQAILEGTPGPTWGIVLMLVSLAFFIIGFTMGGLNYVVTVLQARTRGLTLMRLPLTIWGIFMATVLALFAFPALFVSAIMMLLDVLMGTSFFMPAVVVGGKVLDYDGGSPVLFQHLFWFFGHPEVYIVALPAFGIVSELIAVHARKNIFGYRMMVWAILAIGGLSFVVWAHHMYVSGMNPYFGFFFATTTLIIAVPTALKVYNWVLTLWRGNIHLTVPMLFAIGFVFSFINGGLTGLFLGNVTVDLPLSDTMFVVAHFHMVMAVAPVLVVFGAIYHWYPKVTGRMLDDRLGKLHFWITFVGTYLIYFPMHYLGILGVPRRYYAVQNIEFIPDSAHSVNVFITIAALSVGVAQVLFIWNLIKSYFHGEPSGPNPWRATTLEWQTPHTPPHHGNFGETLPVVYRWAYDYSVPGAKEDFLPQNQPPEKKAATLEEKAVTIALVFLSLIMALVVGWLIRKTINKQPWVERQLADGLPDDDSVAMPPVKVALGTFLAVATSLFSLLVSAYFMRKMAADDWVKLSVPGFLWFNTGVLVLCSIAVQWTRAAAHRGRLESVRMGLLAGGLLTLAFLAGQWWVWQLLVAAGHYLHANPANAFFYLLTAVHALHLLGGLWVWGSATVMAWRGDDARKVTLRVELCTVYWHYLLLVWLVLFALLLSN